MSKPAAFKQDDVRRAVAGCRAAGLEIGTVRISPTGEIEVYTRGAEGIERANALDAKVFGAP